MKNSILRYAALAFFSLLPLGFGGGGSEIGNGRWIPPFNYKNGAPYPKAGQRPMPPGGIVVAEVSSEQVKPGETFWVKVLLESADEISECGGRLRTDYLRLINVHFDRCEFKKIYPRVHELTLYWNVPELIADQSFELESVQWLTPGTDKLKSVSTARFITQIASGVEPPAIRLNGAEIQRSGKTADGIALGEPFDLVFHIDTAYPVTGAVLDFQFDQGGFESRLSAPLSPGKDPVGWVENVLWENGKLIVRMRIPAEYELASFIRFRSLSLMNSALQEEILSLDLESPLGMKPETTGTEPN